MPAYDAYGQTDVLADPNYVRAMRRRPLRDQSRQQFEEALAERQEKEAQRTTVDDAINAAPTVDQLVNQPAAPQTKSAFEIENEKLDRHIDQLQHGNTQPPNDSAPKTAEDYVRENQERDAALFAAANPGRALPTPGTAGDAQLFAAANPGRALGPGTINGNLASSYDQPTGTMLSGQSENYGITRNTTFVPNGDSSSQPAEPIRISNPAPNGVEWPELPKSAFNPGALNQAQKTDYSFGLRNTLGWKDEDQ